MNNTDPLPAPEGFPSNSGGASSSEQAPATPSPAEACPMVLHLPLSAIVSNWLLWGRIEHTGVDEWAALATAVDENNPTARPRVKMRTERTRMAAEACLKDMLTDLGEEVRAAGGRIVDVETDGV